MLAQASHGARNIASRHDLLQEPSLTSIPAHKSSNDLIGQQKYPSGRAIKYYHDMIDSVVEDPTVNIFDKRQRLALLNEMQAQMAPSAINLDTIDGQLQQLAEHPDQRDLRQRAYSTASSEATTPGTATPQENKSETRARLQAIRDEETLYRRQLLDDGCPPCLPADNEFYFLDDVADDALPYEHPAAMYYLRGGWSASNRPLSAQLLDWTSFRRLQQRIRDGFLDENDATSMRDYIRSSRDKLRERNWTASAALLDLSRDVTQQTPLQNWLEFMANHVDDNAALRLSAQQRLDDTVDEEDRQWQQQFDARRIALHEGLLDWMEAQRLAMSAVAQEEAEAEKAEAEKAEAEKSEVEKAAAEKAAREKAAADTAGAITGLPRRVTTRLKGLITHTISSPAQHKDAAQQVAGVAMQRTRRKPVPTKRTAINITVTKESKEPRKANQPKETIDSKEPRKPALSTVPEERSESRNPMTSPPTKQHSQHDQQRLHIFLRKAVKRDKNKHASASSMAPSHHLWSNRLRRVSRAL